MSDTILCFYKCMLKTEEYRKPPHWFLVPLMDTQKPSSMPVLQMVCLTGQGWGVYTSGHHATIRFSIRWTSVFCQPAEGRTDRKSQFQTFPQADTFLKEQIWRLWMRNRILLTLPIPVAPWKACISRGTHTLAYCPLS